jgi:hypothetical protein
MCHALGMLPGIRLIACALLVACGAGGETANSLADVETLGGTGGETENSTLGAPDEPAAGGSASDFESGDAGEPSVPQNGKPQASGGKPAGGSGSIGDSSIGGKPASGGAGGALQSGGSGGAGTGGAGGSSGAAPACIDSSKRDKCGASCAITFEICGSAAAWRAANGERWQCQSANPLVCETAFTQAYAWLQACCG